MPCAESWADRLRRHSRTCPDRHLRPVQPAAGRRPSRRRICRCARPTGRTKPTGPLRLTTMTLRLRDKDKPAPSRIGQIPTYGLPAANGANGLRLQLAQPHAQETKALSGPGQAETFARSRHPGACHGTAIGNHGAAAAVDPAVADRQQDAAGACDGRHRRGPAAAQASEGRRRSVRRGRRLRRQLPDQVGGRTQRRLRHQSRPASRAAGLAVLGGRAGIPRGLRLGSPRAGRRSARDRSPAMAASLPSIVDGGISPAPTNVDRPDFTGHIDGRLDVTQRHPFDRGSALACRHRQSRQPEHPGRHGQISDLHHARRHLRHRPEFQPPGGFRRRHRRPHRLPEFGAHRRQLDHQRRPQLQPVRRRRPRQLRSDAGAEAVRRGRGRQPRARSLRSTATAMRAIPPAATPRPAPRSNSPGC